MQSENSEFHNGFSNQLHRTSNDDPEPKTPFLIKYGLPPDIIAHANTIFIKMGRPVHRKIRHIQLLFWITYCAHLEAQVKVDFQTLGEKFGLKKDQITKTDSLFRCGDYPYTPPDIHIDLVSSIADLCKEIKISDGLSETILCHAKRLIEDYPQLNDDKPKKMASAIIHRYCDINGHDFDKNLLVEKGMINKATLNNTVNKLNELAG